MVKNSTANARDMDLFPGPGRHLGGGNGNTLQAGKSMNLMDSNPLGPRVGQD